MNEQIERELNWNDSIENDSTFILLKDGEYDFTVTKFERGRHNGSDKLPPCNKAVLTLEINSPEGKVELKHNLFLHTKCEGMLCSFFTAIGLRRKGERLVMDWNKVMGARGRAKISVRNWKSQTGTDMQSNEIKRFIEPDDQPNMTQYNTPYSTGTTYNNAPRNSAPAFKPGNF